MENTGGWGKKKLPLYEQIYGELKGMILEGKLGPDEKLPGTRSHASSLGVSRSTVDMAYAQLLAEGYIYVKPASGYYVSRVELAGAPAAPGRQDREERRKERGESGPDERRSPGKEEDLIDFSPRSIDMSRFPYATWRRLARELMAGERSDIFERGDPMGDEPLREAIARYLSLSRGIACTAEEILVGAGNDYLLLLLGQILGEGRTIAMENPTYPRARRVFEAIGFSCREVDMDESGIVLESLEASGADLVYAMPAHQYPTGVLMPYGRRAGLLEWARSGERYIIEDDYDAEFRYRGKPVPALKALDTGGRVICVGSFSRSIAPAIRISYMVLPPALMEAYRQNGALLSQTVSRIDQAILTAFLREGHFERHVNRMRKLYREKHDLVLRSLAPLEGSFVIAGQGAGHHILLREREALPWEEALREEKRRADQARLSGVGVYPLGDLYWSGEGSKEKEAAKRAPTFLLGFAGLSAEAIEEGAQRLVQSWRG